MISVLRIGHRPFRDKRITTHVALVARVFTADEILIDTKDDKLEETINSVCKNFGNTFSIKTGVNPYNIVKNWSGIVIHLTMYGEGLRNAISKIPRNRDILIVVGSEKVPSFFYEQADFNISIGNQPHSEVAALAIFLDRYTNGRWLDKKFNGKIIIHPHLKGKNVTIKEEGDA